MLRRSCLLAGVLACGLASAATVTVDPATEYQTITGFGGTGINGSVDDLVNDMGLSAHRVWIEPDGSGAFPVFSILAQLRGLGVRTFIAVPWSPPAQWKSNNDVNNGGNLLPGSYGAFGRWLATFVSNFRTQVGIDLAAISPQNEPRFPEYYPSCVYTKETYRDMLRVVARIFDSLHVTTPLFMAEDMLTNFVSDPFIQLAMADTLIARHAGALSVHGYGDGVNPAPTSEAAQAWGGARGIASYGATKRLPVWQTETSGYQDAWDASPGAFRLAQDMFVALKYGKVALYDYWVLSSYNSWDQNYSLIWNGNKTREYYAFKQYARFVRPGMVQMRSGSSDDSVHVAAFRDKTGHTLAVVLLNTSHATRSASLLGSGLPAQVRVYRSTSSDNCVDAGLVGVASLSLPAQSIVTLTAGSYDPVVGVAEQWLRPVTAGCVTPGDRLRLLDLAGRSRLPGGWSPSPGLYFREGASGPLPCLPIARR